jgi:alpha-N-arabinofuranosidase
MDELVHKHGAIMDAYDPERYVAMIVDEWGTWFEVEPGTNPGFLYQQNTLRDALVAGIHLNIFNNYAERVRMANIAQTVNVLQAAILTEGAKMILTPTYHVFDMYQVHQDAVKLPLSIECDEYVLEGVRLPAVSASASIDKGGRIHVSITNIDPRNERKIRLALRGVSPQKMSGSIITSPNMQDHNTFDKGDTVKIAPFTDAVISTGGFQRDIIVNMPAKSVVTLEIA